MTLSPPGRFCWSLLSSTQKTEEVLAPPAGHRCLRHLLGTGACATCLSSNSSQPVQTAANGDLEYFWGANSLAISHMVQVGLRVPTLLTRREGQSSCKFLARFQEIASTRSQCLLSAQTSWLCQVHVTLSGSKRICVLHFFCIVGHLSTKKGVYVHFHSNVIS